MAFGTRFGLALVVSAGVARPAAAQIVDQFFPASVPGYNQPRDVTVTLRAQPSYDPIPVRAGAFLIRPELDEGFGRDTNVTGRTNGQGSWIDNTHAQLLANSDFGRDALGASFNVFNGTYLDLPRQSRTDFTASLGGTYEIGRDKLTVAASHLSLHEDQTAINSAGLNRPLAFEVEDVRASYQTEIGRWTLEPDLEYIQYRFDPVFAPGAALSQRVRDRDTESAGFTLRYGFIPERSAVLTVRALNTYFVSSQYGGLVRPNSQAYEVLAGTDYAVSGNLRFIVLAGYEVRQFSSSVYPSRSTPVVRAAAVWTPTGLTTLSANVSRTIEDAVGETTTGVTYTQGLATVDHEYRRNWLLHGSVGVQEAQYVAAGAETLYSAGASVNYLLNRNARIGGSYDFVARQGGQNLPALSPVFFGTTVVGNYTRHIVMLRLSLFL